jgi:hypothetical protein
MKKVAVKSALSGAALASALDLYSQRNTAGYKKSRGAIAALSGALGGAALARLLKQIAKETGREAGAAATSAAKGRMSWVGRQAFK